MRIDIHLLKRFEPLCAYVFSGARTELALSNLMDQRLVPIIALGRVHDQFPALFPILTIITWFRATGARFCATLPGPVTVAASGSKGILTWWWLRHLALRLRHPQRVLCAGGSLHKGSQGIRGEIFK